MLTPVFDGPDHALLQGQEVVVAWGNFCNRGHSFDCLAFLILPQDNVVYLAFSREQYYLICDWSDLSECGILKDRACFFVYLRCFGWGYINLIDDCFQHWLLFTLVPDVVETPLENMIFSFIRHNSKTVILSHCYELYLFFSLPVFKFKWTMIVGNFYLVILFDNFAMKQSSFCQYHELIMLNVSINNTCLWQKNLIFLSLNGINKGACAIISQNHLKERTLGQDLGHFLIKIKRTLHCFLICRLWVFSWRL